jgi:hypothetical protein
MGSPSVKYESAPPHASALIESLRGVGYSLPTALADVIDNSIAAGAKNVRVAFDWDGPSSRITIVDDGRGMKEAELFAAMRLGTRSPRDARKTSDLGRFGLGLKTASFSQCRRLTVASRAVKGGKVVIRRWDLDYILNVANDWHLLDSPAEGSEKYIEQALKGSSTGTVVLWELLDRVVSPDVSAKAGLSLWNEQLERAESHLAMVFHDFLEESQLRIHLRGSASERLVKAWDPFMRGNGPIICPPQTIPTTEGNIVVKGFILPHKDRLDQKDWVRGEGPDGWISQQGFYVYRNNRLLLAGSWLGLGSGGRAWTREMAYQLARIRIDIPNTMDDAWRIDIRKSTARPPASVRARLLPIANDVRKRAREVFAFRAGGRASHATAEQPAAPVWQSRTRGDAVRYLVDRTHPLVQAVLGASGEGAALVDAMLRAIEDTVPVQRIWLDAMDRGAVATQVTEATSESLEALHTYYRYLRLKSGMEPKPAKALLASMEPFSRMLQHVGALPDSLS